MIFLLSLQNNYDNKFTIDGNKEPEPINLSDSS